MLLAALLQIVCKLRSMPDERLDTCRLPGSCTLSACSLLTCGQVLPATCLRVPGHCLLRTVHDFLLPLAPGLEANGGGGGPHAGPRCAAAVQHPGPGAGAGRLRRAHPGAGPGAAAAGGQCGAAPPRAGSSSGPLRPGRCGRQNPIEGEPNVMGCTLHASVASSAHSLSPAGDTHFA